ncbi:YqgE/AlgH family protein [Marinicellulosiphila megalodicopiae]|uniref:YqgE/AlgH family protein n=1 Tax=Marinicellulosiphila megalodicopiae TaxID=2724896 RepID=UPI003BB113F8
MTQYLNHNFLIAMPKMDDPHFQHSVIYIAEHDEKGAFGFVLNKPINMNMQMLMQQADIETQLDDNQNLRYGGPVGQDQAFVLYKPSVDHSANLFNPDIALSNSMETLKSIAFGLGPFEYISCLGYAGWTENQLEEEIAENIWLCVEADSKLIWDSPIEDLRKHALKKLKIDESMLSEIGGNC